MKKSCLSTLYKLYKEGIIGRKVFESRLMNAVLSLKDFIPRRFGSKNNFDDFLVWAYQKIMNAVDRYQDMGTTFDVYLRSIIVYAYREYCLIEKEHTITERVVWKEKAAEAEASYVDFEYLENDLPPFMVVKNPRQILMLLLKSYHFITTDFIKRIAPALSMRPEVIEALLLEMHELRKEREAEIHDMKERIHAQYYRCLAFQEKAAEAQPGSVYHTNLLKCHERALKRLISMRENIKHMRLGASNREVAEVLGLSKGAVDAALYIMKKSFEEKNKNAKDKDNKDKPKPDTEKDNCANT